LTDYREPSQFMQALPPLAAWPPWVSSKWMLGVQSIYTQNIT
jgi:hypothetical protein